MNRVFIGIPLSSELRSKTMDWRKAHTDLRVRWIRPEDLHITLIPPWNEAFPQKVVQALSKIEWDPMELSFECILPGPDPYKPRLIWAIGDAPSPLLILVKKIGDALGRELEKRDFKLHATLARLGREEKRLDLSPQKMEWKMICDHFILYKSILKPSGAEYEILGEIFSSGR